MQRFCVRWLFGLAIALSLGTAQAADFDYDWLTAGVIQDDPNGGNSAHGWLVDGSYAFSSHFTLQGSYYKYDLDTAHCAVPTSCELLAKHSSLTLVGAGWHLPMADEVDLLVDAYLGRHDDRTQFTSERLGPGIGTCPTGPGNVTIPGGCAQVSGFDDSGNSWQLDTGVRVRCGCSLEFKAYLGSVRTYRNSGFLSLEGDWKFAGPVALVLEARRLAGSDNQYRLALRYLF